MHEHRLRPLPVEIEGGLDLVLTSLVQESLATLDTLSGQGIINQELSALAQENIALLENAGELATSAEVHPDVPALRNALLSHVKSWSEMCDIVPGWIKEVLPMRNLL